ncbi:MAG: hypothetical protein M3415_01820 [Actinomycetota bacterium]|nr:hypothetical protein [Actinomycetota bacterium]
MSGIAGRAHLVIQSSTRWTGFLLARLPGLGIAGGAVYDALVGATAAEHGWPLATRNRQALDTYRALEVTVLVID